MPWFRSKMAVALVHLPDEHFCRLYPVEARQGYAGGGTWEKSVTPTPVDGVQVGRCKSHFRDVDSP